MNFDCENLADLQDYRHTLHSAGVRLSRKILRYKYCTPTGVKKLLCKSPSSIRQLAQFAHLALSRLHPIACIYLT